MIILATIILGFLAGWLINYLADVLPTQHKIARPVCDSCGNVRTWQDYFLLRACGSCEQKRSLRTAIVLIVMMIVSAAASQYAPEYLGYWVSLLVLTYFGVIFVIDVEHRLILHITSLVGVAIGLIVGIMSNGWLSTLVGGAAGWIIMLGLYYFGTLFARYRARKMGHDDGEEALGFGDVILSGVIGLMVGWPDITSALFVAILAGGVINFIIIIILVSTRRFQSMNIFTAYGPYLVIGAVILIFFPEVAAMVMGR